MLLANPSSPFKSHRSIRDYVAIAVGPPNVYTMRNHPKNYAPQLQVGISYPKDLKGENTTEKETVATYVRRQTIPTRAHQHHAHASQPQRGEVCGRTGTASQLEAIVSTRASPPSGIYVACASMRKVGRGSGKSGEVRKNA